MKILKQIPCLHCRQQMSIAEGDNFYSHSHVCKNKKCWAFEKSLYGDGVVDEEFWGKEFKSIDVRNKNKYTLYAVQDSKTYNIIHLNKVIKKNDKK